MAAALLKTKVAGLGRAAEWRIESAGTWAAPGLPAMPLAQTILQQRGLDVSDHRSQVIDGQLMRTMDLILVMTESHRESLCVEFPVEAHKVMLMSRLIGQTFDIDDPVGGAEQVYEACADELARIIDAGFERLTALTNGGGLA
jgi:protein-tyrosine phosphatase